MSESAIVSCTTHLLNWYRCDDNSSHRGDVDAMVLLQILCENAFVTEEESLQQLLLGISADQGRAVLGWLGGGTKDGTRSLKLWAIAIRALSQEKPDASEAEDLFLELRDEPSWKEKFDQQHSDDSSSVFSDEEEKIITEIYSSLVVAWSRQRNLNRKVKRRIEHWTRELDGYRDGALCLNLAARVALVRMYREAGDPLGAEDYVVGLFRDHENGTIASPPDTMLCNMVLNAWAQKKNGLRAARFFRDRITDPDVVSYNTVINAYARQGQLDRAEEWACLLVSSFADHPVESRRPQQATFTVLLAAWRRSRHPDAAERAEKILRQMHELCDKGVLVGRPELKSYQTVLDTWEKSSQSDAAQRAEEFLRSAPNYFQTNQRLVEKVRYIRSRHNKRNKKNRRRRRPQNDDAKPNDGSSLAS